jgi:hypothetical protein
LPEIAIHSLESMDYFSAEGHSREAREDEVLVVQRQLHGSK